MFQLPLWFTREPILAERLRALGVEAERLIDAAEYLGINAILLRRWILWGSEDDLVAIIAHAVQLRQFTGEKDV